MADRSTTLHARLAVAGALVALAGCTSAGPPEGLPPGSAATTAAPGTAPGASASRSAPGPDAPGPDSPPAGPTATAATATALPGIRVAGTVEGFDHPWDLRFLPDGTPLLTERAGRVVAVVDGRRHVVAEVPGVLARGEGGLLGLALDPQFAANRRIYLCLVAGTAGAARDVRVVRFRLAADLSGLSRATPVVTGIPAGTGSRHVGCRLEVGPDGMLWVTTGDAVQPQLPQDPTSRAGKVLRATLDGRPAPGNPGGHWDPYVFTIGHRNPQGLAFRPSDGAAFVVEHGTSCDDELNRLQPGGNYGWDPVGPQGRYAEQAAMTDPGIADAIPALWSSGCPTIAPSGAEFITGTPWGPWTGALAIAVLKAQELMLMTLDGDAVTATTTRLAGDLGRLRMVRTGPDGSLWLLEDAGPGAVVRLAPRPG